MFSITITALGAPVTLADGVPMSGMQAQGTTGYYLFPFTVISTAPALTLYLDAYFGTPDLFVNLTSPGSPVYTTQLIPQAGEGAARVCALRYSYLTFPPPPPVFSPQGPLRAQSRLR